jgi:hypothetical protein
MGIHHQPGAEQAAILQGFDAGALPEQGSGRTIAEPAAEGQSEALQ